MSSSRGLQRYKCQWLEFHPSSSTPAGSLQGERWNRHLPPFHFSSRALRRASLLVERAGGGLDVVDEDLLLVFAPPGEGMRRLRGELEALLGPEGGARLGSQRLLCDW